MTTSPRLKIKIVVILSNKEMWNVVMMILILGLNAAEIFKINAFLHSSGTSFRRY